MNILARLIKVIHWFVLIDIFLLIVGSIIYYFEFGYLDLEDLAPREFFWITWLCIIIQIRGNKHMLPTNTCFQKITISRK